MHASRRQIMRSQISIISKKGEMKMKNNKSNQVKTTIFSVVSLFALTLLCHPSVYGQIPPPKTAPVTPSRQPTPKPATNTTVNPARRVPGQATTKAPVTPKDLPLPKAVKLAPKYSPVKVDSSKYGVIRIRIENKGPADVPKGIWIGAILTIVDTSSNPPRDTGCG